MGRAVREELIQVPLSTACSVVLFIGALEDPRLFGFGTVGFRVQRRGAWGLGFPNPEGPSTIIVGIWAPKSINYTMTWALWEGM